MNAVGWTAVHYVGYLENPAYETAVDTLVMELCLPVCTMLRGCLPSLWSWTEVPADIALFVAEHSLWGRQGKGSGPVGFKMLGWERPRAFWGVLPLLLSSALTLSSYISPGLPGKCVLLVRSV